MSKSTLFDKLKCRYWAKVSIPVESDNNDRCWLWLASTDSKGYGEFWIGKAIAQSTLTKVRATRIALYLSDGIWDESKHILHICDNPNCVNPKHLIRGTHLENMKDRDTKNRNKPRIKFSPDIILAIRDADKSITNNELCTLFGMSDAHVSRVRRGIGKRKDV